MSSPSSSIPLHPEDAEIVEYARDVCRPLNITRIQPRTVSWVRRLALDQIMIFQDDIKLPEKMIGRLTANEWKPLVASSLAYYDDISRKLLRMGLKNLIVPFTAAVLVLVFVLLQVLAIDGSTGRVLLLVSIASYLVYAAFWLKRYFGSLKALWLEADRRVAEFSADGSLLRVLRKIRESGLEPRGRAVYLVRPTITERIHALEKAHN